LKIHSMFPPNTRVFSVTGVEDRLIGFDMYSPPYDLEIKQLRRQLEDMAPTEIDEAVLTRIRDLARKKNLRYAMVDHYWAAVELSELRWLSQRLQEYQRLSGISQDRLEELLRGDSEPTEDEEPFIEPMRECLDELRRNSPGEQMALEKIRHLREMMKASPHFTSILDSGPLGVTLFEVKANTGQTPE
ncbi:unnamed protein product, partial [marine sediment metagenome]